MHSVMTHQYVTYIKLINSIPYPMYQLKNLIYFIKSNIVTSSSSIHFYFRINPTIWSNHSCTICNLYRIGNSIWNYKSIYHISIYFSFLFIVTNPRKWNPIHFHIIRIYRWYIPPSESIARNIHSCTICNINSNPKPISIYSYTISKSNLLYIILHSYIFVKMKSNSTSYHNASLETFCPMTHTICNLYTLTKSKIIFINPSTIYQSNLWSQSQLQIGWN